MPPARTPRGPAPRSTPTRVAPAADRREQRRLQHQDLSRAQLLDAAEAVFGRKGFHDTALKEVAERAGFSVGSVYSFFESKDDLFVSVFLRRGAQFMPLLEAIVAGGGDPMTLVHEVVDLEVGFFRQHPEFGRLYLRTSSALSPSADQETDLGRLLAPNFGRAMELQAELFRRGQAAGVVRPGDPVVLARMLSGLIASYQSLDPAVVDDDRPGERLALRDLHDIVDGAFAAVP